MKTKNTPDFLKTLEVLEKHGVDYIVVGGVSAVLQGAPIATFDLDIVHSRAPDNIKKLLNALMHLHARFRGQGSRTIRPEESHLKSSGHQLLETDTGVLDVLGTVGDGLDYGALLGSTLHITIGGKRMIRILSLDKLIELKEKLGRAKDKAVLITLKETLEEQRKMKVK